MMAPAIHVFPVPRGMTPEEAWAELSVFQSFPEYRWWRLRFRWPFLRWAWLRVDEED